MSIILVAAMENFMMLMSDGRVSQTIGEITIVSDEDYKKLLRINKNVCIGFAGAKEPCLKILRIINNYNGENLSLYKTIEIMHKRTAEVCEEYPGVPITIIIGGKNNGKMEFCTFCAKHGLNKEYSKPIGEDVKYAMLHNSDKVDKSIFLKYLKRELPLDSYEKFYKAMSDCVDEAASISSDVNTKKFVEVISNV